MACKDDDVDVARSGVGGEGMDAPAMQRSRECLGVFFAFFGFYQELARRAYDCILEVGDASWLDWHLRGRVAHRYRAAIREK